MKKNQNTQDDIYRLETTACENQLDARDDLSKLFQNSPLSEQDLLFNLGLYTRSSLLVKYITMHELYKEFEPIPGCFVEFGTWYGQNMVLLENLRAIHEPFNKQRKIIGFDSFEGYQSVTQHDKNSSTWENHSYNTTTEYINYLKSLLVTHEKMNVLGHLNNCHEIVKGDIKTTAPKYFEQNKHLIVAFAYFDIGVYEPTKAALLAIQNHLVKGSVLLMDELTWEESPGEALAFKEVMNARPYSIKKCKYYPTKSIVTIL